MGIPNCIMKHGTLRQSDENASSTDALLDGMVFLFHTWNPLFDNVLLWKLLRFILFLYQNFFFFKPKLFCLRQYCFQA